jgi:hypothetical protein
MIVVAVLRYWVDHRLVSTGNSLTTSSDLGTACRSAFLDRQLEQAFLAFSPGGLIGFIYKRRRQKLA